MIDERKRVRDEKRKIRVAFKMYSLWKTECAEQIADAAINTLFVINPGTCSFVKPSLPAIICSTYLFSITAIANFRVGTSSRLQKMRSN